MMRTDNLFLLIAFALSMPACSGLSVYQQKCEQQHKKFSDMVSCLRNSTDKNVGFSVDGGYQDLAQLYIAYAEALKNKVDQGRISEADAKVSLAQFNYYLNNEMQIRNLQTQMALDQAIASFASYQAFNAPRVIGSPTPVMHTHTPITCQRRGNYINCY